MKKVLSVLAASLLLTSSLVGCSTPKTTEEDNKEPSTETQSIEVADNTEEKQVVSIFHHMSEEEKRVALEEMTDKVTEEYPNITFDIQAMDYSQYGTMLKTKIASGDAPDIIFGNPAGYTDLVRAGHILDISDQSFINNISENTMSSMKVDGKVYGIPMSIQSIGLFYNKDVFEENGVAVPTTYDELINVADTFVSKGVIPFAHGFKDTWTMQPDFQGDFYAKPLSKMPNIYTEIEAGNKKFADYPEFKKSLERYAKRISYSSGDDFGTDATRAYQMLATGKAAMLAQGDWGISEVRKANPDANIGFIINPTENNAADNLLPIQPGNAFMISSQSKVKDGALKFFEFAASPEGGQIWSDTTKNISVVNGVSKDNLDPIAVEIAKYIENNQTYNFEAEPVFVGQRDAVFRKFQEEFGADQKRDIDAYIAKLDKEFENID